MNLRKLSGGLLNSVYLYKYRHLSAGQPIMLSYNLQTYLVDLRCQLAGRGLPLTKNDSRLAGLRNKYRGKRCFIIGMGPSLNKTDLQPLRKEITFGTNKIYLLSEKIGFLPTYYTVEDQFLAMQCYEEINSVTGTTKLFPDDLMRLGIRPNLETIFFRRIHNYPNYPRFQPNALKPLYHGGTITYTNMQLAYYMGIREVYLVGVDFDYGGLDMVKGDFLVDAQEVPYFHPEYRKPGERWNLPRLERMGRSFQEAKRFFEQNGGVIYNATIGGKLEVFPRVDYDSLF